MITSRDSQASAGLTASLLTRLPEWDLAHLHGRLIAAMGRCPQRRAFVLLLIQQLVRLSCRWLRRLGAPIHLQCGDDCAEVWAYVATTNQWRAIQPICSELRKKDRLLRVLVDPALDASIISGEGYSVTLLRYGPGLILSSFLLFFRRLPRLWWWCVEQGVAFLFFASLSEFAMAYPLIIGAPDLFRRGKPLLLLLANDHTPDASALWVAASGLGIPTAYVQHAFVTSDFPPLRCTLNFLYGRFSLDAYLSSAVRFSQPSPPASVPLGEGLVSQVLLAGVVSRLQLATSVSRLGVGIGLNHGDDFNSILLFIESLRGINLPLLIRPHPRYPKKRLLRLRFALAARSDVLIFPPSKQPLEVFLSSIAVLVAGDSSLHLDAALAGIACFYPSFRSVAVSDYYGFQESGLVRAWPEALVQSLSGQKLLMALSSQKPPPEVLRQYSSSYRTSVQGREAECIAAWIDGWVSGLPPESLGRLVSVPHAPFPVYCPDPTCCLADRP